MLHPTARQCPHVHSWTPCDGCYPSPRANISMLASLRASVATAIPQTNTGSANITRAYRWPYAVTTQWFVDQSRRFGGTASC